MEQSVYWERSIKCRTDRRTVNGWILLVATEIFIRFFLAYLFLFSSNGWNNPTVVAAGAPSVGIWHRSRSRGQHPTAFRILSRNRVDEELENNLIYFVMVVERERREVFLVHPALLENTKEIHFRWKGNEEEEDLSVNCAWCIALNCRLSWPAKTIVDYYNYTCNRKIIMIVSLSVFILCNARLQIHPNL